MLPTELYVKIFENLDFLSLLTCMRVCSLFRDLVVGTTSLQYTIELAVGCQRDESQCTLPSSARLEKLRRHRDAWRQMKWSRDIRIPMEHGGLWELYGGVLAQSTADGKLVFHQLPSDLRSIEEKHWSIGPDFGFIIRDFGMDPSQDLLLLIENPNWSEPNLKNLEYRIHLRSLSTGKDHLLGPKSSVLSLPQIVRDLDVSYTIQVSGHLVAVCFCAGSEVNELAIWDWKTGALLFNAASDHLLSFSLLSDKWILLCITDDDGNPALATVDFGKELSERQYLEFVEHIHIFEYPEFAEEVFFYDMDVRSDPGPLWKPNPTTVQTPFSQNAKESVFVVNIWFAANGALKSLVHFIPSDHLLSLSETNDPLSGAVFSWEAWGANNTRLIMPQDPPSDTWVCYVYGTKYVFHEPALIGREGFSVRLCDFNQLTLRKDADKIDDSEALNVIKKGSTTITAKAVFDEDVDTWLPYWCRTLHIEDAHEHSTVLCSEDNVIVVDTECREYRVLVF